MPETEILSITIILNGLFLILLNGMFWKKTAGCRALWVCHLVVCLWFLVPFLVVSAIFETALLPLAYANKVELYPYAWMNTVAAWAVMCLLFFMAAEYLLLWRVAGRWLQWASSNAGPRWDLFVSPAVREIKAHMTAAEKNKMDWWAFRSGILGYITFMLPSTILINYQPNPPLAVILVVLVATFLVSLPYLLKAQRQMLCSTAWAKEQGLTPERVKLFAFKS